jgi:hypothetical protein
MLIPKNKKVSVITNPFRPKIGVPNKDSLCRLTWGEYHIDFDQIEPRIRVDASHNDEFIAELEALIPRDERYRCKDREVWLVDGKWKKDVVALAKKYFDETITELRTWE